MKAYKPTRKISVALQGAGSHGAFSWGVLDRLLEEPDLQIEGVSGTSSGSLNAAALLQGYATGGAEGARACLKALWEGIAGLATKQLPQRSPMDHIFGNWNLDHSPMTFLQDMVGRMMMPDNAKPLDINPLRDFLLTFIDAPLIRNCAAIKLFVAATDVEAGTARLFARNEISVDVLMASACLPMAFRAARIGQEYFWDGGYTSNPSLWPLIDHCVTSDLFVVQLIPFARRGVPSNIGEISMRVDEITFNSALMASLRGIARQQLDVQTGKLIPTAGGGFKPVYLHMLHDAKGLGDLGAVSRMTMDLPFLTHLRDLGRQCAATWLSQHKDKLGDESSVDLGLLAKNGIVRAIPAGSRTASPLTHLQRRA